MIVTLGSARPIRLRRFALWLRPRRLTALLTLGGVLVGASLCAAGGAAPPNPSPQSKAPGLQPAAPKANRANPDSFRLQFRLPAGLTLPGDFVPQVYAKRDREHAEVTWINGQPNRRLARVRPDGHGAFDVVLTHPDQPFFVAIQEQEFLRFFERGPFRQSDLKQGSLEIVVDKPATLSVRFDRGPDSPAKLPFDTEWLSVTRKMEGSRLADLPLVTEELLTGEERATDLSAGEYTVIVTTRAKPPVKNLRGPQRSPVNPGVFSATKKVTLKPGQTENVVLRYKPIDLNAFRGRHTAILKCAKTNGESAAGKPIWVGYLDWAYGSLPVFDGRVGPSGEVTLTGLTEHVSEGVRGLPYSVWAGDELIGRFNFSTSEPSETFPMTFPPDAGDMAPDVDLIDVSTQQRVKLSSLRGRLVCLDFWASWSGASRRSLKELDHLAATKSGRDRLALVALSIDDKADDVAPLFSANSWTHLVPYWAGPNGIQSPAARRFAVKTIPKSFLIAPDGHILWRGHPNATVSGKNLTTRIQEALGL
jgi:hypothetical protein